MVETSLSFFFLTFSQNKLNVSNVLVVDVVYFVLARLDQEWRVKLYSIFFGTFGRLENEDAHRLEDFSLPNYLLEY